MLLKKNTAGAFTKAFGNLAWGQVGDGSSSHLSKSKEKPNNKAKKQYFEEKLKDDPKKLKEAKDLYPRLEY